MNKYLGKLAIVLLSISCNVFGQPQRGNWDPANMPKESVISGKVLEQITSNPIEYATVGVYSMRDSSLVSGGITDVKGFFSIDKLPYGRFYLEVSFVGFKKVRINGIGLNPNQKAANAGDIKLEAASTALSEVEVVGNRSQVEYKIDKKVVNVSSNIIAAGGTAVDALENVPSVQVDIEGNVALRGNSNFTVLIDGRPSVLKGSEALQQIPASSIQNIEIITNPSAKYDPEGSAGIINVIMKKQKQAGMNGVVNTSVSTNGGYSGDFLFNLRASKFNYYIGANYNDMRFKNSMRSDKESYIVDTTFFENVSASGVFKRRGYGVKGGIDFFVDPKNTISLSGSYRDFNMGREANSFSHFYRNDLLINDFTTGFNDFDRSHSSIEGNLDYTRKFNESGHQLQASVNYSQGPESENTYRTEDTTDLNWNIIVNTNPLIQRTIEGGDESEFTAKLDYSLPFSGTSKLEAGYQGDYEFSSDTYNLENFNTLSGSWDNDLNSYNNMEFSDQVQAFYSTYSSSLDKIFDYQVGFRAEYSDRILKQKKINEDIAFKKWDYFPTVHISKKMQGDLQLQASYSRRIRRPGERELDPCEVIMDSRNIRVGNPNVTPEYTDSYELNLQKSFNGKGFISGEFFYKHRKDLISDVELKDTLRVPGSIINIQTFANVKSDYSTGFEGMINMPLAKWWTLNSSISLYDYRISGDDPESNTIDNSSFTWSARINSMFRLKWGTQIQLMAFYNAPSVTSQGTREGFYFTNIGVRQDLLKRKLTLSVQVRDLLGNSKFERTNEGSNFKSFYSMKRQAQVVTFSVSFKINNYKPDRKERENVNEMEFSGGGEGMM